MGGHEGRSRSLKKKALRKRREVRFISTQKGYSVSVSAVSACPSMKYTHREHKRCAGEPCTSDSYGAAFATMLRKNLLFYCSFEH